MSDPLDASALDEESKALLRRILERTAYRQRMAANIRGHGLKYVLDLSVQRSIVADLDSVLSVSSEVERVYAALDGGDLALQVRDAMERVPYPYSRLELAMCLAFVDRAERHVAASYVESKSADMGRIARMLVGGERAGTKLLEAQLAEFCAEATNRPAAQQFVNRWLALTLVAFGRPETAGDQRARKLELRTRSIADVVAGYAADARAFVQSIGLVLPDPATLGIEISPNAAAALSAR